MMGVHALCAVLLLAAGPAPTPPPVSLEVIDTEPARQANLHYNEAFFLRIAYQTDRPIRVFARPFYAGERAANSSGPASHPGQILPAGSGETLGWFAYRGYANVDEVRIRAVSAETNEELLNISVPVQLYWDDIKPATRQVRPDWVVSLNAAQQKSVATPTPSSASDLALGQIIILVVFAMIILGIAWPIWGWLKWQGGWKLLAGVPLLVFGGWILFIIAGVAFDPTAHNLWPFELLMLAFCSLPYMLVITIWRRIQLARQAD